MDKPEISVICPVYNTEQFLEKSVSSVLNQTFSNFELILVDDGSTDKSGEICDNFAACDNRVKVYHTANGGVANARNVGFEKSVGKYITFFDSDDRAETDWLNKMYLSIGQSELCVCGFFCEKEGETGKQTAKQNGMSYKRTVDQKQCFHEIFDGEVATYTWNKLFLRSIIEKYSIYSDPKTYWVEDAQFVAEYCSKINQAVIIEDKLYHYIERTGSVVHSNYNPRMLSFLHGYRKIEKIAEELSEENTARVTTCVHCQSLIYRAFFANENRDVIRTLKREIVSRRHALISGKGRIAQRISCLLMSVSVPITCRLLRLYKRFKG